MSEKSSTFTPSLIAALFLLCRELLPDWNGWPKTVAPMLEMAGSGKTQAYEILDRLRTLLPTLLGTPGRPASEPAATSVVNDIVVAAYRFLLRNPGSAYLNGKRHTYSDDYRRFIVGLVNPGQPAEKMSIEALSKASEVPLGTLKEWLTLIHPRKSQESSPDRPEGDQEDSSQQAEEVDSDKEARFASGEPEPAPPPAKEMVLNFTHNTHLRAIVRMWPLWKGTFQAFCRMIRTDQRLPHSDSFISNFLESIGLRSRKVKTPVESPLSGGTFRNLFPGAQWLGDGTNIGIRLLGRLFVFNLEALLDCASNGTVGFTISDTENEKALRLAFEAGVKTTGVPPLSTTMDNKAPNISPGGRAAVGALSRFEEAYPVTGRYLAARVGLTIIGGAASPLRRVCSWANPTTIFLRATPGRGQAKAALEGSFGLFQQTMPPLVVEGETLREMARSILNLIFTAWYRGRNGKPRKRLGGLSPKQFYENARPTEEDIRQARLWLEELQRREKQARLTREARRDPVRLERLKKGLTELGISDPGDRIAISLAYYSREAIAQGLAVFQAKKELGTIPSDADHDRYLGGIICNIDTQLELDRISKYYLEQRIRLGDITLRHLEYAAQEIRAEVPQRDLPQAFADRALKATYGIDFDYWAQAAARALAAQPASQRTELYHSLCRRIASTFKADKARREKLICILADVTALAA